MSHGEGNVPHPFVFWAQNKTHISLRVDLKDVKVNIYHGIGSHH